MVRRVYGGVVGDDAAAGGVRTGVAVGNRRCGDSGGVGVVVRCCGVVDDVGGGLCGACVADGVGCGATDGAGVAGGGGTLVVALFVSVATLSMVSVALTAGCYASIVSVRYVTAVVMVQ